MPFLKALPEKMSEKLGLQQKDACFCLCFRFCRAEKLPGGKKETAVLYMDIDYMSQREREREREMERDARAQESREEERTVSYSFFSFSFLTLYAEDGDGDGEIGG